MLNKMNTKIKIFIGLFGAFLLVSSLAPHAFLANSPRVNPLFVQNVKNAPVYIAGLPGKIINSINTSVTNLAKKTNSSDDNTINSLASVTPPPQAVFQTFATGVSAYEDTTANNTLFKVDKGTKYTLEPYTLPSGEVVNAIVIQ